MRLAAIRSRPAAGRSRAAVAAGVLAAIVCLIVASEALAQPKVDQVVLRNGDRLTCEIERLLRGQLTAKTDDLSTVSIQWEKIASVTSPAEYEVELASGARQFGSLSSPSPGLLKVGAEAPVPMVDVITLAPVKGNFWKRLDGSLQAGASYTEASNRTQFTLDADVTARTKLTVTRLSFQSLVATENDVDPENRQTLSMEVDRDVSRTWYVSLLEQATRNEQLALDYRSATGGLAGHWIVRSHVTLFSVFAGAAYTREKYASEAPANRAEGLLGSRWDFFTFGDRATNISVTTLVFIDLRNGDRLRAEADASIRHKIVKDLQWAVSLFESFNSSPPEGEQKNDFGATLSVGWTF